MQFHIARLARGGESGKLPIYTTCCDCTPSGVVITSYRHWVSLGTSRIRAVDQTLLPVGESGYAHSLIGTLPYCILSFSSLYIYFSITSPHNIKVVDEIVKSIGTSKFNEDQSYNYCVHSTAGRLKGYFLSIGGCTTYRKTLVGKERGKSTPIKAQKQIRSRKQRISLLVL